MSLKIIMCFILFLFSISATAQDTLKINIRQSEDLFFKNNFYLLASSMNIEAQKAQIIQAKLYPNPIFTADINAFDPENKKIFHVGNTGQKSFQIEQLIVLGGKRKSEIEIAKSNSKIAELEFQQLVRKLKFRLHNDLFAIGQISSLLARYNQQLNLLETLLTSYELQAHKGNIPLKDVVRLKGAYLKLNNERATLLKEYLETQSSLQTILKTSSIVEFEYFESDISKYIQNKQLNEINREAKENRPEFQILQHNKILAEQYWQYQKRLAVPDINMFTAYDQRSGAFNNQVNIGFSIPLPFLNRNQGNITAAQYKIHESEYQIQAMENEMYSELHNAYALYLQSVSEYQKTRLLYNQDFEITVKGMTDNFKKRNVNIIEFIDFFEAYNDAMNELTRIKTQLVFSAEQINLLTGTDIF